MVLTRRALLSLALLVRIHLEAMMRSPRRYLTAAKWRVMGKRVRARAQFAPILMKTSRAYEWWALQRDSAELPSQAGEPVVIGLIEAGARGSALDMTLASLAAEGIPYHVLDPLAANQRRQIVDNIAWGATPWLLPVYAGDSLAPGTIRAYREQIRKADAAVIYADDDTWGRMARPTAPHFKPDWNPELFRHLDYLTGACVIRVDHAMLATALCEADWARALVEEALAGRAPAAHLPMVLHHRAARPAPSLPLSPLPIAPTLPPLTAIIPTRNRVDLLATCLAGLEAADYSEIEAIVVDNDSDDAATLAFLGDLPARSRPGRQFRVLRHPGPFNYSAINNRAVAEATGELICLLNNDIEMRSPDWLKIMATQALRDDVGAVGAQLLYPDGRIQHAGVVIGVGNAAGHAHRFLRPEEEGYFRRHALPQFISAVTAACLVVKRERFLAVGGLDEVSFPVAFNDVDLCLKLNQRGWQSFYEPRAVLIHHESVSRGFDTDPVGAARFAGELAALQQRWQTDTIVDPYHHPQLSRASEQFVIAL